MKKIVFIAILGLYFCLTGNAQEMLGLVNSNYAGSAGVLQNPSSFNSSRLYADLNLFTADVCFQNNYIYVAKEDYFFPYFFGHNHQFPKHADQKSTYDNYQGQYKHGFGDFRINGPSFMLNIGKHSFGFQESVRGAISVRDVPYHLAKFFYEGFDYSKQHGIKFIDNSTRISQMTWGEVGFTYSYNIIRRKASLFYIGGTLKYLKGMSGFYASNYNTEYEIPQSDTIHFKNLDAKVGQTLGGSLFSGSGYGADIGVTFALMPSGSQPLTYKRLCQQRFDDYQIKIGLSILDLGFITFNKGAEVYNYKGKDVISTNTDSLKILNQEEAIAALNSRLPITSIDSKFSIATPTALSLQVDYHIQNFWYLNSSFVYGVKLGSTSLRRPTQLSVSPRFEREWLEICLPLALYEFKYPRLGLSLRFGPLTIGSDKLGGFFDFNDFYGLDFYASLRLGLSKGDCSGSSWDFSKPIKKMFYRSHGF